MYDNQTKPTTNGRGQAVMEKTKKTQMKKKKKLTNNKEIKLICLCGDVCFQKENTATTQIGIIITTTLNSYTMSLY